MKRAILFFLLLAAAAAGEPRSVVGDYALILEGEPVARATQSRAELKGATAQARAQRLRAAQAPILAELKRRAVPVAGSDQMLVNAIFVTTTYESALELRGVAGVTHVVRLPRFKPEMDRAADLVNASAAWSAVGGSASGGAGVKIGIIDTGLELSHAAFQDSSTPPAGFPKGEAAYTNGKVVVARSYGSLNSASDPASSSPDDYTPRDRFGHGTAIAMIAAGKEVTSPRGVIRGIAPKAYLGNYKVFGSPGLNAYASYAAVQQALTDALADGMDIVTLALGEGDPAVYGPIDVDANPNVCGGACDIYAQAVENASRNGMAVVAAAGNDGNIGTRSPTLGMIHTPGTAPSAITVGASTNSHNLFAAVRVSGAGVPSSLQSIQATFGDGPRINSALTAPVRDVTQLGNDGLACTALRSGSLTGAIALIAQGTCLFSDKINHAQAAGAVGVIIYQTITNTTINGAGNTGVPAVMISTGDGAALRSYLASASATASLDPTLTAVESTPDTVAVFSSRGPALGTFSNPEFQTYVIKPELVAPGVGIYTAAQTLDPNGDAYNATGYTGVTGTSYAVAMVAGAAALVKQNNSRITRPEQIKSAVANSARDIGAGVNASGAGRLNLGDAVSVAATLEPATVEFGALTTTSVDISRAITITNVGNSAATFNLSVNQTGGGLQPQVSASTFTLQSGASQQFSLRLNGARPSAGSYEGYVAVSGAGPTLRLPYQYLVGDGVPYNIFPTINGDFSGAVSDLNWLIGIRLVDRYGVPVLNQRVDFAVESGGGSIVAADPQTARWGIAAARINLGPTVGDQLFTAKTGGLTQTFYGNARPLPALRSSNPVTDAASFRPDSSFGIAPGSYISIFGSALSDATQVEPTASLPYALSTVNVSFDSDNGNSTYLSVPGRIHFVTPGQVNVQVPWEFQGRSSVLMKVSVGVIPTSTYTLKLAAYSPGVFEYTDGGTRIAATIDVDPAAPAAAYIVSQRAPARRGHALELFLNGLGPVSNRPASGEPSPASPISQTNEAPRIRIGGIEAPVSFTGLAPGIVGLYQVNVTIPQNAPTGLVPIVVSIGGVDSTPSNLPVQ